MEIRVKIHALRGVLLSLLIAAAAFACNESTTVGNVSYNGSNWTVDGTLDYWSHTDTEMELVRYEWDAISNPATLTLTPGSPFTQQDVRYRMVIYTDSTDPVTFIDYSHTQEDMGLDELHGSAQNYTWQPAVLDYTDGLNPFVHYKVQSKGDDVNATISAGQFTLSKECP